MPAGQPPADPVGVDAATLERVANAYMEISEIQQAAQARLANEQDQAVIQQETQQANQQMLAAVQNHGVTPDQYQEVIEAVNQDAAVRARFTQLVQAGEQGQAAGQPAPQGVERQQAAQAPGQEAPAQEVPEVSADELESAAEAYTAITELNQEIREDLQGEDDPAVIQDRVAQAETTQAQIIDDAGLNMAAYTRIIQAVQQDPELMQQFLAHLED